MSLWHAIRSLTLFVAIYLKGTRTLRCYRLNAYLAHLAYLVNTHSHSLTHSTIRKFQLKFYILFRYLINQIIIFFWRVVIFEFYGWLWSELVHQRFNWLLNYVRINDMYDYRWGLFESMYLYSHCRYGHKHNRNICNYKTVTYKPSQLA